MKTTTLFALAVVLVSNLALAAADFQGKPTIYNDNAIEFNERGITFIVFPNGEFDFNTDTNISPSTVYRNGRRSTTNNTYGAPGFAQNAVLIQHDNQGRVRRIGNVFVNYDNANRIKRIGSVYMTYNRFGLAQIGGLQITYNRNGQIANTFGVVKNDQQQSYVYQNSPVQQVNYTAPNNLNDYYYYRPDGTKAKVEEPKLLQIEEN